MRAGDKSWVRWVDPGGSFQCSNDPRVHFGLGAADRVDQVRILWTDGRKEIFDGGPADRRLVLRRGDGRVMEKEP